MSRVLHSSENRQVLFWDPPDTAAHVPQGEEYGFSLDQVLGSTTPFVLVARQLNELLRRNHLVHVADIVADGPVPYVAWRRQDGKYRLLTGDLEEGVNHAGTQRREVTVIIPWRGPAGRALSSPTSSTRETTIRTNRVLEIKLRQAESRLYGF